MPRSQQNERLVLNLSSMGLTDVPLLGRYEYCRARPGFGTHELPDTIEIRYLEKGYQTYHASGRHYHLVSGDVFVTAPGERHDTSSHAEEHGILYRLNLRIPKTGQSLLMLPAAESAALAAKLASLPYRQFAGQPLLKQIFNKMFVICEQPVHPLLRVALVNELLRCALEVINCAYQQENLQPSPSIVKIVERIKSHPEEDNLLTQLAEEAGLSLSRFKASFKEQVGLAPHEFILRCKVDAAKRLLLDERRSVTATAMDLGFSSSQYFATVFKRFTFQTPLEFRAKGTNGISSASL